MKINDETILAALISTGSVRKAANECGIGEATVRRRLADKDFAERYKAEKEHILTETADNLIAQLGAAVDALRNVIDDDSAPHSVIVSAADTLLKHSLRYLEAVDIERRIAALEEANNERY